MSESSSPSPLPRYPDGGAFVLAAPQPDAVFTPEQFDDEQRLVAETAERFAADEIVPRTEAIEHQEFDQTLALLRKAAELGLTSVDIPEEYGGQQLGFICSAIVADRIAKQGSFSVSFGAHVGIGTLPLVYFGTEEQKRRYLPKLAGGEWIAAYALSEAEAGSDALAVRTRATLNPDGKSYRLNGEKMWISNAAFADLFTVFAKVNGEQFTCFLVEKTWPGVSTGAEEKKMGIKGSSTRPLILRDVDVPLENVLGEVGRGHVIAFNILNVGRFKLGAACCGGARTVLAAATGYARQRKAFGKAIGEFGLVRSMLAEMAIGLYACEAAVYRTVGLIAGRLEQAPGGRQAGAAETRKTLEEYALECSIIKVFGSEMLDRAVDLNVQIHGGYGFVQEYGAERAYRDSRVNRIFEGTNEINRLLIPGMLLRRAQKGELALMPAIQSVMAELLAPPQPPGDDPLAQQAEGARKTALVLAGAAFQRFREKLSDEQEVLAGIADVLIDVYVLQSVLARARKRGGAGGDATVAATVASTIAAIVVSEALDRVEQQARRVLAACSAGDELRAQAAFIRRLLKRDPVNVLALRHTLAGAVLEAGGAPF